MKKLSDKQERFKIFFLECLDKICALYDVLGAAQVQTLYWGNLKYLQEILTVKVISDSEIAYKRGQYVFRFKKKTVDVLKDDIDLVARFKIKEQTFDYVDNLK